MKKKIAGCLLAAALGVALLGCQSAPELAGNKEVIFQYSTLGSLLQGVYDGEMTYSELKRHGDTGLGTFNALDGEMIQVDRRFYQIKADGVAYRVDGDMKTPFAVTTHFEPDQTTTIDETMDCEQLKQYLDGLLPTKNIPYALKLTGRFDYLETRSVPRQEKPYPRLLEVLERQPTFEFHGTEGVMVWFRLPGYVEGANAPGYHFHFIDKERKAGGHVLSCKIQNVKAEIDYTNEWYTVLPEDEEFYNVEMTEDEYR